MTNEPPPGNGSFILSSDGTWIPVSNVTWGPIETPDAPPIQLPRLRDLNVTVSLPLSAAVPILRAVGEEAVADRIDVATHPDLAELDLQLDGFYDGPDAAR